MNIGYIMALTVITMFDWLNDVANLRHNSFATSSSSEKTAFAFDFFDVLYALKSFIDA